MNLRLAALLFVASLVADAWAQAPGVPVQNNWMSVHDPGLIGKARALKDAGRKACALVMRMLGDGIGGGAELLFRPC